MDRNQNSFASKISMEEVNELKRESFQGAIHVIDSLEKLEDHLPYLQDQTVLGFDTETKPSFKKGKSNQVALLQLATNDQAFLFRLNKMKLPDEIISIFEDPHVFKIGAAIHDDLRALKKIKAFSPQSFVDLQDYVEDFSIESKSLKKLAGIILNIRISKSQRLSNWESTVLTGVQQLYAATDAWVCHEIYQKLENIAKKDE